MGKATFVGDKFQVVRPVVAAGTAGRRQGARPEPRAREPLAQTWWLGRKQPAGWTAREAERGEQLKHKPRVPGWA